MKIKRFSLWKAVSPKLKEEKLVFMSIVIDDNEGVATFAFFAVKK